MDAFTHRAFYNEEKRRIEMHLVSTRTQKVGCDDSAICFAKGESIHTESSYKYSVEGFAELAGRTGFTARRVWLDKAALFSVH